MKFKGGGVQVGNFQKKILELAFCFLEENRLIY